MPDAARLSDDGGTMTDEATDLATLGEFGLIGRFAATAAEGSHTLTGIGDDTAVIDVDGTRLLFTTDLMVEGVHFLSSSADLADVGFKALVSNVSDIAAMGGHPRECVVSLAAPPSTPVEALDRLWEGLSEAASAYGVTVVGGDTSSAPVLFVNVALIGEAPEGEWVGRDGAREDDEVYVTGTFGDAAGGLVMLLEERSPGDVDEERLVTAHLRPRARVAEGAAALAAGATAMIDVSDGLVADLGHVCERSGVGILLDAGEVPISAELARAAPRLGADALGLALVGGEDYELAIAVPAERSSDLVARVEALGTRCSRVGTVVEGDTDTVAGHDRSDGSAGWDHFGGTEPREGAR